MYILYIVAMTRNIRIANLLNTYFFIAKFRFSQ